MIYFWVKIITFSSRSTFLFKFVGHGFPVKAFLIDIVTYAVSHNVWNSLSSQHFPAPHMEIKKIRKTKLLQEMWNPLLTTSGCQRKPADFHSPLWSVTQFCYDFVISRFDLRNRAHVKLYIGLFHCRRSEELSAVTIDGCRYASVRVTNNQKCD